MKNKILLFFYYLFVFNALHAQYSPSSFPLTENGKTYAMPWAGGMNLPQFSEVDLNNDGIMDLVSYDREGDVASTFINGGTAGLVDYDYAKELEKRFVSRDD